MDECHSDHLWLTHSLTHHFVHSLAHILALTLVGGGVGCCGVACRGVAAGLGSSEGARRKIENRDEILTRALAVRDTPP